MKELRYNFRYFDQCNLCESDSSQFKVLGKRLNQSQGKQPRKKTGIATTVVQCKHCGLIFSNPQPVPYDIQDHYGTPPEDYWKEEYFKVHAHYFKEQIQWLQKLRDTEPTIKTLDIGAGIGKCMLAMQKQGWDAYGLEPSEPFYRRAIERMGLSPQRLQLASIETADYSASSFDFITFGAVLEHLYDPSASIRKALYWLKPGGIIHIEVPSSDWLVNKLLNWYYQFRGTDYVSNISPMHAPFHLYEFSLKSFEAHSQKNAYEIADHGYYVCDTYLPKAIDFFIKPYMKWTDTGMQLVVWLRKT